jgi:hypothetical protein
VGLGEYELSDHVQIDHAGNVDGGVLVCLSEVFGA